MIILTKLFLAHLIGDFVLQPGEWVKDKFQKKIFSSKIYLHILIHFSLLFVLLWDISLWKLAVTLGITHFAIDIVKIYFQDKNNSIRWFFTDQILHIVSIIVIYSIFIKPNWEIINFIDEKFLLLTTFIVFITFVSSIIIRITMQRWTKEIKTDDADDSLDNAGTYVGILERLFIFIFVLTGNWASIGFLLTAKSVFRFGDLRDAKDRKLTEYMLIGTLLSFGIAILSALFYQWII